MERVVKLQLMDLVDSILFFYYPANSNRRPSSLSPVGSGPCGFIFIFFPFTSVAFSFCPSNCIGSTDAVKFVFLLLLLLVRRVLFFVTIRSPPERVASFFRLGTLSLHNSIEREKNMAQMRSDGKSNEANRTTPSMCDPIKMSLASSTTTTDVSSFLSFFQ